MRHHLVVLHNQYLNLLLAGEKRIECRLSSARRPPYEAVTRGDLLWLKLPSGPIRAVAMAGECSFRALHREGELTSLIRQFAGDIRAQTGFFEDAAKWARFCTLIWIETVIAIRPMTVRKADQRAWVVMDEMPWPGMRVAGRKGPLKNRP